MSDAGLTGSDWSGVALAAAVWKIATHLLWLVDAKSMRTVSETLFMSQTRGGCHLILEMACKNVSMAACLLCVLLVRPG